MGVVEAGDLDRSGTGNDKKYRKDIDRRLSFVTMLSHAESGRG
jgi:hypothetical protein